MKKFYLILLCAQLFFIACSTKKSQKEEVKNEVITSDTLSAAQEKPHQIKYQIGDRIHKDNNLWKNILFRLKREDVSRLNGEVGGGLETGENSRKMEDIEILLVDSEGVVKQIIKVRKDGYFLFSKLPPEDYTVLLDHEDPTIRAKMITAIDESSSPTINSTPDKIYIMKNMLRQLKRDDFIAEYNTIEVILSAVNKESLDNLLVMILDDQGKVIEKFMTNGRKKFIFEKLPRGNYTLLVHNKTKGVTAEMRVLKDDSELKLEAHTDAQNFAEPSLNSHPDNAYILKHTLKKLFREEFPKSYSKVQVSLKATGVQSWDNMVLLILDEEGKVIEKVLSNGKDHFVFEKLPQGNYTFLLHNKPENIQAEVKLIEDQPLVVHEEPVVKKEALGEREFLEGMNEYYKLNYSKALAHFRESEHKDYHDVFYLLGRMYENGEGVAASESKALHYYEKGVSKGDSKANIGLGVLYHDGKGVPKDTSKARIYFQKAIPAIREKANENNMFWITRLGFLYNFGYGVPEDYKEASKWYMKAANMGYAFAQFNLGVMYENGLGVRQDYKEAA
ncbi:MAG: sel1 repeat family protein, partial [Cytophagales bacterium]|nr:sel1 repeat family protein [Cytophagales bacterium]